MTECDGIGRELEVVTVNTSTAGLEEGGRERREGEKRGREEREGRKGGERGRDHYFSKNIVFI